MNVNLVVLLASHRWHCIFEAAGGAKSWAESGNPVEVRLFPQPQLRHSCATNSPSKGTSEQFVGASGMVGKSYNARSELHGREATEAAQQGLQLRRQ